MSQTVMSAAASIDATCCEEVKEKAQAGNDSSNSIQKNPSTRGKGQHQLKHTKLYSDVLQTEKRKPLIALRSQQRRPSFLCPWYPTAGTEEVAEL